MGRDIRSTDERLHGVVDDVHVDTGANPDNAHAKRPGDAENGEVVRRRHGHALRLGRSAAIVLINLRVVADGRKRCVGNDFERDGPGDPGINTASAAAGHVGDAMDHLRLHHHAAGARTLQRADGWRRAVRIHPGTVLDQRLRRIARQRNGERPGAANRADADARRPGYRHAR